VKERSYDLVGRGLRKCSADQARAPHQRLGGGAHTASARIAQQRPDVCGAGKSDADWLFHAERPKLRHIIKNCPCVETELSDDVDRKPRCLGGGNFLRHGAHQLLIANTRMPLRVTGDADGPHAAAAKQPAVNRVDGAAEWSVSVAIAGNNEDSLDVRVAVQARKKIIQRAGTLEIA